MGIFDGMIVSAIIGVIEKNGGLPALVGQFEKNGMGGIIQSWIGNGVNQPISPEQVTQGLGPELMQVLSAKSGFPVQALAQKLAEVLPKAVDKMTPDGRIP